MLRISSRVVVRPGPPSRPAPAPLTENAHAARRTEAHTAARALSSDQLFNGAHELHIEHRGTIYRLRRTSLGKLILTK
jgi:hemin uptake protein HemP